MKYFTLKNTHFLTSLTALRSIIKVVCLSVGMSVISLFTCILPHSQPCGDGLNGEFILSQARTVASPSHTEAVLAVR